ncbi:hypothetical protein ACJJTC_011280 [Scirpophaga incertulas]
MLRLQCTIIVFCLIIGSIITAPPSTTKTYRSDYTYNRKTDAFYKLHTETATRIEAGKVCEMEGAALMVPSSHQDVVQLHGTFKQFQEIDNFVWVAEDGQEHEEPEEPAIIELTQSSDESQTAWSRSCDAVDRSGEIVNLQCYQRHPFMCKVTARDAPYDRVCDVYALGYQLNRNVGSCYKIPKRAGTWNQAYAQCRADGGHLVVLNSQAEHDAVFALMNTEPKVENSQAWWYFYAGFRAENSEEGSPRVFKTIFNETLDEAGYGIWAENEPNNFMKHEDCGTLFKNDGKLNDALCNHLYGYICEKEVAPK